MCVYFKDTHPLSLRLLEELEHLGIEESRLLKQGWKMYSDLLRKG